MSNPDVNAIAKRRQSYLATEGPAQIVGVRLDELGERREVAPGFEIVDEMFACIRNRARETTRRRTRVIRKGVTEDAFDRMPSGRLEQTRQGHAKRGHPSRAARSFEENAKGRPGFGNDSRMGGPRLRSERASDGERLQLLPAHGARDAIGERKDDEPRRPYEVPGTFSGALDRQHLGGAVRAPFGEVAAGDGGRCHATALQHSLCHPRRSRVGLEFWA